MTPATLGLMVLFALPTGPKLPTTEPIMPRSDVTPCTTGIPVFLRAGATEGVGTDAKPFGSLAAAMQTAALARWCELDLRVAPGTYRESLVLDRHLRLRKWPEGARATPATDGSSKPSVPKTLVLRGNVGNSGPWRLDLAGLFIDDAPGSAAIHVSHASAVTRLEGVTIRRAQRRGIVHVGGTLFATRVHVQETQRVDGQVSTGVAIQARNGARVRLIDVDVIGSAAAGLMIRDGHTLVVAEDLEIRNTRVALDTETMVAEMQAASASLAGLAAIDVDGGKLTALRLVIAGAPLGVFLRHGARARLRTIDVSGVQSVMSGSVGTGGAALWVISNAVFDLADYKFHHSAFGLRMVGTTGSMRDGLFADLDTGVVTGGLPIDFDSRCLSGGMRMERVGTEFNVSSFDITVPDPDGPRIEYRPCPTVAAETIE